MAWTQNLDTEYAAMAADTEYEAEPLEWSGSAPDDGLDNNDEDWSWLYPDASHPEKGS